MKRDGRRIVFSLNRAIGESLVYKRNMISGMIFQTVGLVIQLFVWIALYASVANQPIAGRALSDMFTYVIIVSLVTNITNGGKVAALLEERMKSGEIALDTLRPASPRLMMAARSWGDKLNWFIAFFISCKRLCFKR